LPIGIFFGMRRRASARLKSLSAVSSIIIIIGILLTDSISGYFLGLASGVISIIYMMSTKHLRLWGIIVLVLIVSLFVIDFHFFGKHSKELLNEFVSQSETGRRQVFSTTMQAIRDFGFFGSGPGSFHDIYLAYEDRSTITGVFVPHAHNEFLQTLLEFGWIGLLLVVLFLVWIFRLGLELVGGAHKNNRVTPLLYIALLCPIVHSLVDYPMRTITVSSAFLFLVLSVRRFENDNLRIR